MSYAAVTVDGLSKQYRLGAREAGYQTLRESIVGAFGALGRLGRSRNDQEGVLWALRDVSFSLPAGKAVGIIGRNGAGKTTLLRILARITEPSGGRAVVRGRVASLLEVGTGFHPELTGRENVFLNAAILGMSRAEIRRKFDEIVEFRRDRTVHRYPRQALLQWDADPPGVLRGRAPGTGHPDSRRGAGGR